MDRAREQVERAGARLYLIGQATPRQAAHFRRRQKIDLPVLADEKRTSYKAAGTKMGSLNELLGPRVVMKGILTSARAGTVQTRTVGHPAQLGGSMLIDRDGRVLWSHMSEDAGDNASVDEILEAIVAAPARPAAT